ncbi:MAG: Mpo1-like protein [Ferruginibacter sp.]
MKTIQQWLAEYAESHKNETNKTIHWICVPSIFFSLIGMFYSIKLPFITGKIELNMALPVTLLAVIYYASLSKTIWIGMLLFCMFCLGLCYIIESTGILPLWLFCGIVFIIAWVGQFYGHKVEGKKPSFLKDVHFLLIGPAWLMSFIYAKLHIRL